MSDYVDEVDEADPLARLREPVPSYWRYRLDPLVARLGEPLVRRIVIIAIAALGMVLLVGATALAVIHFANAPSSPLASQHEDTPSPIGAASGVTSIPMVTVTTPTTARSEVAVHAAGAVVAPGLYHLSGSPRVADLIEVAGGLAADADVDRINLAAPLNDGARLYVPHRGETSVPIPVGAEEAPGSAPAGSAEPSETNPLNLNSATADQLEALPGVGPATAKAILDYRTAHGPFRSVEGLLEVRGIGPAKMEALRGLVRV